MQHVVLFSVPIDAVDLKKSACTIVPEIFIIFLLAGTLPVGNATSLL
jgi:hypothetical protein